MQYEKQVVVFRVGSVHYGFPIEQVNEIIRYAAPTKIPNSPDYLDGIINLRGKVYAVIDMRSLLGMERISADENTEIIVANDINLGFIVDEVSMIVTPKKDEIDDVSSLPAYINKDYVLHILKVDREVTIVINMKNILNTGLKDKKAV